ncbi:MAG: hypothetical protein HY706_15290 [Candidatus Hydrogenedentes bacterium]|nr:hypothetical protein [Candidatus Hydrogenedentota bacterium]
MNKRFGVVRISLAIIMMIAFSANSAAPAENPKKESPATELQQTVQTHLKKGIELGEQGKFKKAVEEFQEVLKLQQSLSEPRVCLRVPGTVRQCDCRLYETDGTGTV